MDAHVLTRWLVILLGCGIARAESPTAAIPDSQINTQLELAISTAPGANPQGVFQVIGLTDDARNHTPVRVLAT